MDPAGTNAALTAQNAPRDTPPILQQFHFTLANPGPTPDAQSTWSLQHVNIALDRPLTAESSWSLALLACIAPKPPQLKRQATLDNFTPCPGTTAQMHSSC